ncbi:carbohydrate kinase family protein [Candidatus Uhrbacteria bacterium]|nr:carbohydrate kinase family protein [Candidatus Uhrbacteria bacterium]
MTAKKPSFDVIAIGESLRDVFYLLHEASVSCSLHTERCLLCLEYAEKIPVQHIVKVHAAGNSANAAVGSARLGLKSALVSWVGKDAAGQEIQFALETEGVDQKYVLVDEKSSTSEATLLIFKGERTQLVHFEPRTYVLPKLPSTRCIYYSAMGNKHQAFDKMLVAELKKRPETKFSFQPGTTHVRAGLSAIKALIRQSWLFILNKDEAHHLLPDGDRTIHNLCENFYHLGAKIVVITDGVKGAFAFDGKTHWHMPIFPGDAFERTGAGDSFATAVTCALLKNLDLPEALRWGAANSWSVVKQVGPQAGLLTESAMNKVLKAHSKYNARIISV